MKKRIITGVIALAVGLLLVVLTLPLNIVTLGIAYPIVNVIILQFCDLLMGKTFDISGIFAPFVIAVFISFLKIVLDNLITKKVGR